MSYMQSQSLAIFICIMIRINVATTFNCTSTECQWYLVKYVWWLELDILPVMFNQHIGSLYHQKGKQNGYCSILKMSVKGASTTFGLLNQVIGK
jgi:hypothetical protein